MRLSLTTLLFYGWPLLAWGAYVLAGRLYGAPLLFGSRVKRVARLTGGQAVIGRSTVGGHAVWARNGQPFYFYERVTPGGRWTVLSVGVEGARLPQLQVRPRKGRVPLLAPPMVLPRATQADPDQDAAFATVFEVRHPVGPPPEPLETGVAVALIETAELCHPRRPVLEVHIDRCRLFLPGILRGTDERIDLLEVGCRVLDAVLREYLGPLPQGQIQILDVFLHTEGAAGVCPVCGEPIQERPVSCSKCRTVHHGECWEYTGVCAVFGCGSNRCTN